MALRPKAGFASPIKTGIGTQVRLKPGFLRVIDVSVDTGRTVITRVPQ